MSMAAATKVAKTEQKSRGYSDEQWKDGVEILRRMRETMLPVEIDVTLYRLKEIEAKMRKDGIIVVEDTPDLKEEFVKSITSKE